MFVFQQHNAPSIRCVTGFFQAMKTDFFLVGVATEERLINGVGRHFRFPGCLGQAYRDVTGGFFCSGFSVLVFLRVLVFVLS